MSAPDFRFEYAPDLPGSDRASRYGLGAVRKLIDILWDVTVEGLEHIPRTGSAIITPNHLAFCDSIFIPAALPRRIWGVGKGEYMDSWKTKHVLPAIGMIPIDRSGGDAAQAALDTAARVLDGGHLFVMYPEGTRSRTGHLHKGRTGAARLAARCDVPIIPAGHAGTLSIQPPGSMRLRTGKQLLIRFGEPMHIGDFGNPADPRVVRAFTDAVMFEISNLSGQPYVDAYASRDDVPAVPADADGSSSDAAATRHPPVSVPPGRATKIPVGASSA